MNLKSKLVSISLAGTLAMAVACLLVSRSVVQRQGVEHALQSMRAALQQSEAVREHSAAMAEARALRTDHLRETLLEVQRTGGDISRTGLYRTIPIVAGWRALETVSRAEGYQLRVAREDARNPKNLPGAEEKEILRYFESHREAAEYFAVKEDAGEMVYARPIVLSRDCLSCHGDPGKSPTGDGKDLLGYPMEGWKTGERRGVFVLRQSLAGVRKHVEVGLRSILVPAGFVFLLVLWGVNQLATRITAGLAAIRALAREDGAPRG